VLTTNPVSDVWALAWFTKGRALASHSVDHFEDDAVSMAPSLRDFKAMHSSGNPLKSICIVSKPQTLASVLMTKNKSCKYGPTFS
jgi:hypothetical protein